MIRTTGRIVLVALALVSVGLVGCASGRSADVPEVEVLSASAQVAQARASLELLGRNRFAETATMEIARAEQLLADVEEAIAEGDGDEELATVKLEVVRAQLGALKALFVRREAEAALENVRSGYERQRDSLETLEEENRRLLESNGDLP